METLRKILHIAVLLALLAILVPIAYEVNHERVTFESNVRKISALISRTEQTIANFKEASDQWKTTQEQAAKDSTAVLKSTKETLASIHTLVSNTDARLATLSTALAEAVNTQNQSLNQTQIHLRQNLQEMSSATQQLQKTLASADAVISSPELQKSLASLAESSEHTSEATASLAATTKDVQQVADAFRSDYLKPKNRALAYLKAILGLGSQSRILLSK